MTLVQKTIDGTTYYTDQKVYYSSQPVATAEDTLWDFACLALGITRKRGFTSQETKEITDLAGIGPFHPTRFRLLKNDEPAPVPYLPNGSAKLQPGDILLRSVVDPTLPAPRLAGPAPASTKSAADRLTEIEDLHARKLLTEAEYREKRASVIAGL